MRRFVGWVLAAVLVCGGAAHASGSHQNWKAVKRLGVGIAVEVRSAGQAGVEECRVVRADDTALTCERERDPNADWDAGSGARLVFPRNAVEEVWVWTDASDRKVLLEMGIGFALGALLCSGGGPGPAFICAGIGALIGACAAVGGAPTGPWWSPPGIPRRMPAREMVRKLVYRMPAGAAVSP
jgi:hypothetical protein